MTISEDLGRLEVADPETYRDIYITLGNYIHDVRSWEERKAGGKAKIEYFQSQTPMEQTVYDGIVLTCIQRAIKTRIDAGDWVSCQQGFSGTSAYCWCYIFPKGKEEILGEAETPAEAILSAYLAAVEANNAHI